MNWEALGAIGEVGGAVAVVGSLVYLAVQIRQNTGQLEEQSRNHELTSLIAVEACFSNFRGMVTRNAQVASLWHRALEDLDQLSPEERTQADYLFREFFWSWANFWVKVHRGDFRETDMELATFEDPNSEMDRHLQHEGVRAWWDRDDNRVLFFPEFAEVVDRIVHRYDGSGP